MYRKVRDANMRQCVKQPNTTAKPCETIQLEEVRHLHIVERDFLALGFVCVDVRRVVVQRERQSLQRIFARRVARFSLLNSSEERSMGAAWVVARCIDREARFWIAKERELDRPDMGDAVEEQLRHLSSPSRQIVRTV